MTITNGRVNPDDKATHLAALIADAREYFGEDLLDGDESIVESIYGPVAELQAEFEEELAKVLDSAQIDHAEGLALDYLTASKGVARKQATYSTGTARFSRATAATQDYPIPKGTIVQTQGTTPIRFVTDASAVLSTGDTSVDVAITAQSAGVDGNVGANTLTVLPSAPSGVESVTNPAATSGGAEEETDDELRARAKTQLSEGSSSTPDAIITAIQNLPDVKSVSAFWNDEATTDADGMPPHSGEVVVQGGNGQDIAQTIMDKKAWGDTFTSGIHGTSEGPYTVTLVNEQTHSLSISRPTEVKIYVDTDIQVDDTYEGDNAVFDAIVSYIGGLLSTGGTTGGLGVGDDVLIGEVEAAIRGVGGVYDVTSIAIDTTASPVATTNIAIPDGSVATSDATDGSLTLTTTQI